MMPVNGKLFVASKNLKFDPFLIKPFDTVNDIKQFIIKHFLNRGDPIKKFGANIRFSLLGPLYKEGIISQGKLDSNVQIEKEDVSLFTLGASAGCSIILNGDIILESDMPKPCMTLTYIKGDPTTCNYYTCGTCGINWVCENCMKACHKGHEIKEYLMNHTPTWACCYCVKIGKCRLPNKSNPIAPLEMS